MRISFEDHTNDILMFEIADESYTVQNAIPAAKKIAIGIIAANTKDGVANFFKQRNMKFI
ncbi:HAD hydrolase family protein [Candidatus Harpocratesius sp.]